MNPDGHYVLYWMVAYRRPSWNFSLERAVEWAMQLNKPLVIFEALRCGHQWASDRLFQFVIEGMADNARNMVESKALYYTYIEPRPGAGSGLLAAMAQHACVVVTDDFPSFFLPRMLAAAVRRLKVRIEKVDSNGLLPMRAADQVYKRAVDFRRFLQRVLPFHLGEMVNPDPLAGYTLPKLERLPAEIEDAWPNAARDLLQPGYISLTRYDIDHSVKPITISGGANAARKQLHAFLDQHLAVYAEERNEPEKNATSGLSPYLHFGHISAHEVFAQLADREQWTLNDIHAKATGSKSGWWGMSKSAEALLDQLVTWRELGFNFCWQRDDYDRYESLPGWAQKTLAEHADDPREHIYSLEEFETARTHDPIWNAAQIQLVTEGRIHGYLRMLWGKKIIEWTPSPQIALEVMIELNNKYAIDGRNPNSYSGIFWTLGRYDRPWGPERPIFGKVRYMSSKQAARKFKLKKYIEKYNSLQTQLFD